MDLVIGEWTVDLPRWPIPITISVVFSRSAPIEVLVNSALLMKGEELVVLDFQPAEGL